MHARERRSERHQRVDGIAIVTAEELRSNDATSAASSGWPDLDETDLRIVKAAHGDGRASVTGLSKAAGLPVGTVRQRYERLTSRGLLHTVALIDPGAVGRPVVAHLDVTTRLRNRDLALRLARVPGVAWIGVAADFEKLLVQVSAATNEALVTLLNEHIRSDPNVGDVVTSMVLRSWSPHFRFEDTPSPKASLNDIVWRTGKGSARPLDEQDRAILNRLEIDARMTITAIAKRVGLSVPATRQRLMRLVGEGTVRFRTRPSPNSPRLSVVRLVLGIHDDSSRIVEQLVALPHVNFVSESTGSSPLSMELLCANEAQIAEAYERVCRVPGVTSARLVRFGSIVVHTGHW
jgi:DNA-binding Lrp family transcriptional regulator